MQIVAVTKGMRYFYLPLNLTILSESSFDASVYNQVPDEVENVAPDFTVAQSKFELTFNPDGGES
jgi:hypothetical protein